MDFRRIVIEHTAPVLVNGTHLKSGPSALDWPREADLVIEPKPTRALDINDNLRMIQVITPPTQANVFRRFENVELARGEDSDWFTVRTEKIAYDLGVKLRDPKISQRDGKIILDDERCELDFDTKTSKIHHRVRRTFKSAPLPFMFLQYVRNGEFTLAREMLSFEISASALEKFFGIDAHCFASQTDRCANFEILLNNYLGDERFVTIVTNGAPKTFEFQVKDGKIANIR